MLVALALQPVAEPDLAEQVDRRLLEDAGPDPRRDVLLRPGLDHDRLDALAASRCASSIPAGPAPTIATWVRSSCMQVVDRAGRPRERRFRWAEVDAVADPCHRPASLRSRPDRRCWLAGRVASTPVDLACHLGVAHRRARPRGPASGVPAARRASRVDGPVRRATLFATAHGHLRGRAERRPRRRRGADSRLHRVPAPHPGPVLRRHRRCSARATNTLDALLADGWYRGQVGVGRAHDQWGSETAFLAQLEVEHEDGSVTVVGTDATLAVVDQPHHASPT